MWVCACATETVRVTCVMQTTESKLGRQPAGRVPRVLMYEATLATSLRPWPVSCPVLPGERTVYLYHKAVEEIQMTQARGDLTLLSLTKG